MNLAEFVIPGFRFWRKHEIGKRLMRPIRKARNRRRERRGLPPLTEEEDTMPKHWLSWGGIIAMGVGFGLQMLGVGECSPEELAAGAQACVDPTAVQSVVNGLSEALEGAGAIVAAIGKVRNMKREKALVAAVATKSSD
jgi:hypothetical protein